MLRPTKITNPTSEEQKKKNIEAQAVIDQENLKRFTLQANSYYEKVSK